MDTNYMNTFDTLKITSNITKKTYVKIAQGLANQLLTKDHKENAGFNALKYTHAKDSLKPYYGISQIEVKPSPDEENKTEPDEGHITFTISAKILGQDYPKLISSDTIIQALNNLKKHPLIEVDPYELLDNAKVYRSDFTIDIPIYNQSFTLKDAINTLKTLQHKKYSIDRYPGGISVKPTTVKDDSRMIFYDKKTELLAKFKKNFDLLKVCRPEAFDGYLRNELVLQNFGKMREYCNLPKGGIFLKSLLNTPLKPNHNFFMKWKMPAPCLFDEAKQHETFRDYVQYKGWKAIIQEANFDAKLIYELIEQSYTGKKTAFKIMKNEVYPAMHRINREESKVNDDILEYITNYLQN